jgi:hypothetical protein
MKWKKIIKLLLWWWGLLLSIFDLIENSRKKIKIKIKIQEDTHEESSKDHSSWWWITKITSEKVGGLECIKLTKLMSQF